MQLFHSYIERLHAYVSTNIYTSNTYLLSRIKGGTTPHARRKLVTGILPIAFFCFTLSIYARAQSPEIREIDNGLVEMSKTGNLPEILIGDELPDEFWDTQISFHYPSDSSISVTLEKFKDKLLVLDFWATYCSPCVKSLDKWEIWQQEFQQEVMVIPIHIYHDSYRVEPFARKKEWALPMVYGEKVDTILNHLFYYGRSFGQIWIKDGKLFAIPISWEVEKADVIKAIQGEVPKKMNLYLTHQEKRKEEDDEEK